MSKAYIISTNTVEDYDNERWNLIATSSKEKANEIVSKLKELCEYEQNFKTSLRELISKEKEPKWPTKPIRSKFISSKYYDEAKLKYNKDCASAANIRDKYYIKLRSLEKQFTKDNYNIPLHLEQIKEQIKLDFIPMREYNFHIEEISFVE